MVAVNRTITNPLTRDFHAGTDGTFLADVPNGTYDVVVALGDASAVRDRVSVWAEGQPLASNVTTQTGQFLEVRGRVDRVRRPVHPPPGRRRRQEPDVRRQRRGPHPVRPERPQPVAGGPPPRPRPGRCTSRGAELGLRFQADTAGYVTGIRFYKGTGNTGTHTGSLWAADGTRLATATFTGETASGWQEVRFATPVAVQPNTTYVASYFSPTAKYSLTSNYFALSGLTNGHLLTLPTSRGGGGVLRPRRRVPDQRPTRAATTGWTGLRPSDRRPDRDLGLPGRQRHQRYHLDRRHRRLQQAHEPGHGECQHGTPPDCRRLDGVGDRDVRRVLPDGHPDPDST